jgi:hypothetical protein
MVLVGDTVMINPTFSPTLARFAGGLGQGCFSMTGPLGSPVRPHFGRVNWLDLQGNEVSKRVVPDVSHRVQHEIDHLDGETFVDRLFDAGQPVRYAHAEHYGLYLANQQKGRRAEPWPKEYYYSSAQWRQVKSGALVTSKFVVR